MCKMPNVKIGIKDMDFTSHRGKLSVSLTICKLEDITNH